jgi:formylglycine-generating enzyme required for sulfatase activity
LILFGCGNAGPAREVRTAPAPFVETVRGSTVAFRMCPVLMENTGDPRVVWFAETETTWDAYDVFYLWLDEFPDGTGVGREGPDAVTRPTPPYVPPDRGWGHGGFPAIGITFHAATKYCEWLSKRTGRRYRLPTVAEWRHAGWDAWGVGLPPMLEMYWFADNAGEQTQPVASLKPNRIALHDIFGNVAEWCVGDDGTPVVCGGSFADRLGDLTDEELQFGRRQSREWNASDPSFPKSKWWLRDAPFVGFRVVTDEGPR